MILQKVTENLYTSSYVYQQTGHCSGELISIRSQMNKKTEAICWMYMKVFLLQKVSAVYVIWLSQGTYFWDPPNQSGRGWGEERGGGGHIAFGADHGIGLGTASRLHSIEPIGGFRLNWHRYIIGTGKRSDNILVTLTSFSRSYQHLPKSIKTYLLNQMIDSDQIIYTDPKKETSDFQVNFACFKTSTRKMFLICIDL